MNNLTNNTSKAAAMLGRRGGKKTAATHTDAERTEWGTQGGKKLLAERGREYYVENANKRWAKYRAKKATENTGAK